MYFAKVEINLLGRFDNTVKRTVDALVQVSNEDLVKDALFDYILDNNYSFHISLGKQQALTPAEAAKLQRTYKLYSIRTLSATAQTVLFVAPS